MSPTDTLPKFVQMNTAESVYRRIALASGPDWRFAHVPSAQGQPDCGDHIELARDLVARGRLDEWLTWDYRDDGRPVILDRQFRPGSGKIELTQAGALSHD